MGRPLLILHLLLHLPAASGLVPAWGRAQCRCLASVLHSYQSETGKTHLPKIKKLFIKQRPEVFIFIIYFLLCRFSRITLRSSRGFFFSAVQADLQHAENLLCLDSAHTAVITQSRDSGSHRTKCCQLWREELAGDKKPQGLVQGLSKHSPPPHPSIIHAASSAVGPLVFPFLLYPQQSGRHRRKYSIIWRRGHKLQELGTEITTHIC